MAKSAFRIIRACVIWIALIATCSLITIFFLLQSDWTYQTFLLPRLNRSLGGTVSVENFRVRLSKGIELTNVHFLDRAGNDNSIAKVVLHYRPLSFFSGEAELAEISIENANITLDAFLGNMGESDAERPRPKSAEEAKALYPPMLSPLLVDKLSLKNVNIRVSGSRFGENYPTVIRLDEIAIEVTDFKTEDGGPLSVKFRYRTEGESSLLPSAAEVSLTSKITLRGDRETVGIESSLFVTGLEGKILETELLSQSLRLNAKMQLDTSGIEILRLSVQCLNRDEQQLLSLSGQGTVPYSGKGIQAKLELENMRDEFLDLFPATKDFASSGNFSGHLSTHFASSKDFQLKANLTVQNLEIPQTPTRDLRKLTFALQTDLTQKGDSTKFSPLALQALEGDRAIGDIKIEGEYIGEGKRPRIDFTISSDSLDATAVASYFPTDSERSDISGANDQPPRESSAPPEFLTMNIPLDGSITAKVNSLNYKEVQLQNFRSSLRLQDGSAELSDTSLLLNNSPISIAARLNPNNSEKRFYARINGEGIELTPLIATFEPELGTEVSGRVQRLTITAASGSTSSTSAPESLQVDTRVKLQKLAVPAYLHETPPVNLLFLPIEVLDQTVGRIGRLVLPKSVTDIVSAANSSLKDAGRIVFDSAQVRLFTNSDGIQIRDTKFDGNVLPTLTFNGSIGFDEALDLVIGIEVLQIPVPLPVTGSLNLPLPNIAMFAPELVRSLGLGALNIGGLFAQKDDSEFFSNSDGSSVAVEKHVKRRVLIAP
ncbi:MAG: hypothetical protein KDD70_16425 [Bdellovibrionales bacterium]|nr:hypothetical protein [Bdellovibrionales bacterium]